MLHHLSAKYTHSSTRSIEEIHLELQVINDLVEISMDLPHINHDFIEYLIARYHDVKEELTIYETNEAILTFVVTDEDLPF